MPSVSLPLLSGSRTAFHRRCYCYGQFQGLLADLHSHIYPQLLSAGCRHFLLHACRGKQAGVCLCRSKQVGACLPSLCLATVACLSHGLRRTSLRRNRYFWTSLISQHAKSGQAGLAYTVYEEMRKEGVEPTPRTFVALLKACSSSEDLEFLKQVHTEVVQHGFESDVYVATMLVSSYAKLRKLVDARLAFEKMPCRDVVSWNAMLLGYTHMDQGEDALQLYSRMQKEGVAPNDKTYVNVLKACSILAASNARTGCNGNSPKTCLETVRSVHLMVKKGKDELDVFLGNILVNVYAKCGSLEDARAVFENITRRDVVSWNVMILGYAQMDRSEEALHLYARMRRESVTPDGRTYLGALKACGSMIELGERSQRDSLAVKRRCLETVKDIQADVVRRKLESDVFVGTMLVDLYAKLGSLPEARQAFEKLPRRDVISWTTMILGYAQIGDGEEALHLYTKMQHAGVLPNERTYVAALKACTALVDMGARNSSHDRPGRGKCLKTVKAIHEDVLKRELGSSVFVATMLVDAYGKCGSLEDARQVFEKMAQRTVVSWNAMMLAYTQMARGEDALQLYNQMQAAGIMPDDRTYVSALKACSTVAASDERNGSSRTLAKERCLETVRFIHANVRKDKLESDAFVGNMLVDAYAKCGSLEDARRVFEQMPARTVISWTAMICGYAQVDEGEVALSLYTRMQQEGVRPNERTYVGALNACGCLAGLEKGKEIHAEILKAEIENLDLLVQHSLIDMYGKCGSMLEAQSVFDTMPCKEVVGWNALIAGYAHQGETDAVFQLFHRMKQEGVQPDGITFLGVLTVCSHAGLVDEGQTYFNVMSRDHGITPTIKHFTCLVDLLGRSGQLDKAMGIIKDMPFSPDSAVWESVLGACRKWRDVELGRRAFEYAVGLDKDNATAYVLMSNIYSAAQMRKEAKGVQAARMKSRAWKQPGRSQWTDMGGVAHCFTAGDQGHREINGIHAKLEELLGKMKKAGYVPHLDSVLRDIPDSEKEGALWVHSEKLAIAYALLKTPAGTTIRVVKNLRVCEDCHKAISFISRMEQRTIICRDVSRFHVCKDGKCSCGDYW